MRCKTSIPIRKSVAFALLLTSAVHSNTVFAQSSDTNIVNEPKAADDLRAAILRIGKRPTDGDALYDAGDASLRLGDAIVALDFLTRAERLAPASGRIKSAMAKAQLALENPLEALRLFEVAVALGVPQREVALDRGLAFDLVGNFGRAQQDYALASSTIASNELTIRQAISFSLSGNHEYADSLLLPLLRSNDPAAWRARAFLLAARGKDKESFKIAQGFLRNDDAENLRPYLKSMDKLTGAQQAAAVHFGHFPASSQIGRDSDNIRIASQSTENLQDAVNANRLQPKGKPLGSKKSDKREAVPQVEVAAAGAENIRLSRLIIVDDPEIKITGVSQPTSSDARTAIASNNLSNNIALNEELPAIGASPDQKPSIADEIQTVPPVKIASLPTAGDGNNRLDAADNSNILSDNITSADNVDEAIFDNAAVSAPAKKELDLQEFIESIEVPDAETNGNRAVNLEAIKAEQRAEREKEEKALAAKRAKEREEAAARQKREDAEKAEAEKREKAKLAEAEKNKARYWVQIATGRDKNALKFDYRRISRKSSDLFNGQSGFTSEWGSTNRLVVGPFDNLSAAKKFESELRSDGGDGFVWRSGNGTIVTPLK